jgi:hypothetical protein
VLTSQQKIKKKHMDMSDESSSEELEEEMTASES